MKRMMGYLKKYKKECILAPLFKMLEASFELFVPLVVANMIDKGIGANNQSVIIDSFLLLILLGVIGLTASITAQYFAARAAINYAGDVKHSLFEHLLTLGFDEIDKLGTSTMITRMTSDINQIQTGVNMVLRLLLRSPFVVFGAMIMAFTIDIKSALIFLAAIVLLGVVIGTLMALNVKQLKKVQERVDKVLGATRENLNGVRVIRAFCKEREETKEFENDNNELTKALNIAGNVSALMNPLTYVLVNAAIIGLIYLDVFQVTLGKLSVGEVVALYNYMSQILVELIKFANLCVIINKSLACSKRISAVFELKPSMIEGSQKKITDSDEAVRFEHVHLSYTGEEEVLSDINISVRKGETIGIIGGTGSGKTSLVSLIPRFYDVSKGAVYVNGVDVRDYSFEALREKIGIVMQKAVLFKGTIRSNLLWANESALDEELAAAVKDAQGMNILEEKDGLDTEVEQGGRNFSGGQKQRLSIARTLLKKPEILILDDSSSALDYLTDLNLRKAILTQDKKQTTFIVSQRIASILHADQILVLDDGIVVGRGQHDELLKSCDVYREIYESQYCVEVKP